LILTIKGMFLIKTNFISLYKFNKMISDKILVSIIVPIYNVESFIAETIESIISQSFKEIEIILVDDGSSDNSYAICESYALRDNRIKLIKQENSGVSIARNNGLSQANGEYIFFMDSDDTIDSEYISSSYEIAKKEDSDIVVIGDYYCDRFSKVLVLPTCAQFIKLDFLKAHNDIRFPEKIQPCEDGLFSHQLLCLTTKVGLNPDGIYHYRQHENQNHHKINENAVKVLAQIPKWLEILENFYEKHDLFNAHSLDLAKFIEHEPYEFRYLAMPLDAVQKEELHSLIKNFMFKNVVPYLNKEDKKKLSEHFLIFMSSKNSSVFDSRYKNYLLKKKIKFKTSLFLINFIPITKIRKRLRDIIYQNYRK